MYFLGLGLVFLLMKYLAVNPVAAWDWWLVLLPFVLAVLWWTWADWSGYTKKKAMARDRARRQARLDKNRESLGTLDKKKRH